MQGDGEGFAPAQIRAFDKETGKIVWEQNLPGPYWGASPMTFSSGGRQILVIAFGGTDASSPDNPGPPQGLIAFGLPQ